MLKVKSILVVCLFFISLYSYAADLVLEGGLHIGGDTISTVVFTSGSERTIKAGELISLAIGGHFELSESLESVVTIGWKSDSIVASNGDLEFRRFPINALVLYKVDEWRIGGGLTYHMSPEYDVNTLFDSYAVQFDDAIGFLIDARYFFSDNAYLGGRFTSIEYETSSGSATIDGSSIGVVIGAQL